MTRNRFGIRIALVLLGCAHSAAPGQDAPKPPEPKSGGKSKLEFAELAKDDKADAKLLKLVGEAFKLKHTAHYVIAYDTDDPTLKAFVNRVEATYKSVVRFADGLGLSIKQPETKLQIFFFNEFDGYQRYAKKQGFPATQEVPGFYSPDKNRSAFFNYANSDAFKKLREQLANAKEAGKNAAAAGGKVNFSRLRTAENRVRLEEERINCNVVQHEVAHQVLYNIGFHATPLANPRWFVEGLAMMFETPPSGAAAGIGAVNQMRLGDWKELKKTGGLPPLKRLISDPLIILPTNKDAGKAYAQAWSLVYYLQRNKRKELLAYIQAVRDRKESRLYSAEEELQTFESAFGPLNDAFVQKYEAFLNKTTYKPSEAGR